MEVYTLRWSEESDSMEYSGGVVGVYDDAEFTYNEMVALAIQEIADNQEVDAIDPNMVTKSEVSDWLKENTDLFTLSDWHLRAEYNDNVYEWNIETHALRTKQK